MVRLSLRCHPPILGRFSCNPESCYRLIGVHPRNGLCYASRLLSVAWSWSNGGGGMIISLGSVSCVLWVWWRRPICLLQWNCWKAVAGIRVWLARGTASSHKDAWGFPATIVPGSRRDRWAWGWPGDQAGSVAGRAGRQAVELLGFVQSWHETVWNLDHRRGRRQRHLAGRIPGRPCSQLAGHSTRLLLGPASSSNRMSVPLRKSSIGNSGFFSFLIKATLDVTVFCRTVRPMMFPALFISCSRFFLSTHVLVLCRGWRVPLIYGQPYGRLPYGRFPDSIFFTFLENFLSFSEKNKFRHFFMSQIIFQSEKLVGRKNLKKQNWWDEKNLTERNLSNGRNKKCT